MLVVREKPCRATTRPGIRCCRLARKQRCSSQALAEMGGNASLKRTRITIAVTPIPWRHGFRPVRRSRRRLLDVRIEDQVTFRAAAAEGVAMGAVTTERCRAQVHPL